MVGLLDARTKKPSKNKHIGFWIDKDLVDLFALNAFITRRYKVDLVVEAFTQYLEGSIEEHSSTIAQMVKNQWDESKQKLYKNDLEKYLSDIIQRVQNLRLEPENFALICKKIKDVMIQEEKEETE